TERPVVVQPGELELFGGKMDEPLEGVARRDRAGGDLRKERFQPRAVHAAWKAGSRYSVKIASASAMDSTWNRRSRRCAEAGSPLVYQPRCFRNSMTVWRESPWSRSASRAWVSATSNRSAASG